MMLSDVISSTSGKLLSGRAQDMNLDLAGLCNNTRNDCVGKMYVAIPGVNFDGHSFIEQAAEAGAVAALVERESNSDSSLPEVEVENSLLAMGKVASAWRQQFDIPLLAITGSVGKTTLKEMSASVLSQKNVGIATEGNLNNEIGVPLTLSRLTAEHDYAVVEMGMSNAGEIEYLTKMASPDVVVINNAAPAHLEGLGSVEGIAKAKGEIIQGLSDSGVAILNADDDFFELWLELADDKQVTSFGLTDAADITAKYQLSDNGYSMQVSGAAGEFELDLPVLGEHNVRNALAVVAATWQMGCSIEEIQQGIASYTPLQNRGGEHQIGNAILIDDSYNANPVSMAAGIETLKLRVEQASQSNLSTKTYLVLGDMGELGEQESQMHFDIGALADVDYLLCSGELSREYVNGFKQNSNHSGEAIHFESQAELAEKLGEFLTGNNGFDQQLVLVKGSRSSGMEKVLNMIINNKNTEGS